MVVGVGGGGLELKRVAYLAFVWVEQRGSETTSQTTPVSFFAARCVRVDKRSGISGVVGERKCALKSLHRPGHSCGK